MNSKEKNIIEINIKDLVTLLLQRWMFILLGIIVFGILFGVIGYYKSAKVVYVTSGNEIPATQEELEAIKKKLSDREIEEVEEAADIYLRYNDLLAYENEYAKKSIRMSIDNQETPCLVSTYFIDDHYEVIYPIIDRRSNVDNIISTYGKLLSDKEVLDDIRKALQTEVDEEYIRELYQVGKEANNLMSITVYARNKNDCYTISEILEKYIDLYTNDIQKTFDEYEINKLTTNYSENYNNSLYSEQQNHNNARNTLKNNMLAAGSSLSSAQKQYYTKLIDVLTAEEEETRIERSVSLKYIAIGMILGMVFVCAVVICMFMFSDVIYSVNEFRSKMDLDILGVINRQKENVLSEADDYIYNTNFVITALDIQIQKEKYKKIAFVSSCKMDEIDELLTKFHEIISKQCEIVVGNQLESNSDLLRNVSESDCVFMIEKCGVTAFNSLETNVKLCEQIGVPTKGLIVLL